MITVHISLPAEKVYIEHTTHGNLTLSPEEAWSIYQRLYEHRSDIEDLVGRRQARFIATGQEQREDKIQ